MQDTSKPLPTRSRRRFVIDFGPLLLFFVANFVYGIYVATAVLVISTVIVLIVSWWLDGRIPMMAAFGGLMVLLFSGLTIFFQDEIFIKIKPTIVSLLIAAGILVARRVGRNPILMMMPTIPPDSEKYVERRLTACFVAMMITVAIANEIARWSLDTDGWVTFKVFGLTIISLLYGGVMTVILARHLSDQNDKTTQ